MSFVRQTVETLTVFVLQLRNVADKVNLSFSTLTAEIMAWSEPDSILTRLLSGDPLSILIAFVISFSLPLLLHLFLYRAATRVTATPTFLLLGSSGAGKTSLLTLLQKRSASINNPESSPTRTSQISHKAILSLPATVPLASNKYRSKNDVSLHEAARNPTRYQLIDTPGHGKLRAEQALSYLEEPSLRGIIYVVDAASLGSGDGAPLKDAATYLHDVLLQLQRMKMGKGSSKAKLEIPVLVAANKQDLFTALPQGAVRARLETEIERVRQSKSKGLVDVGDERGNDDEGGVLGGGGEEQFSFRMFEDDYGIRVEVAGGAVRGEEAGKGVERWEHWIGGCL